MILHLLSFDKFGEYVIKQFSAPEMSSEFVVITQEECESETYVGSYVRQIAEPSPDFDNLLLELGNYKAIVLHGLFYPWQETVLRKVPSNVKVAWAFWGGDIYGRRDLRDRFLSCTSKRITLIQSLKRRIKRKKGTNKYEIPSDLLKRIDYCLTDIPEDFAFVKKYLGTDIKELWYNYYSVEETIGDMMNSTCNGNCILLGNSSTVECNHIDGMMALKKFKTDSASIIVPLSYGESWLRTLISRKGSRMFGVRFHPLLDFLPRQDYNRVIQSCSVVVMPHYRPQAFGNILTALWLGTRVYLSNRNPLFPFFKRIGAILFSLEDDLTPSNPEALTALSSGQREQNRAVIASLYGKESMHLKNLEIVNVLNS